MAVGFVMGCIRAIRASKSLTDLRNVSSTSLRPANLCNLSSSSNEDDIPPLPKKPLSPYMLFLKEKRLETFGNFSKVKPMDQVKALAEKWRELGQVQKQMYSEKYKENLAEYIKIHESYLKSLTQEQRQTLLERNRLRKESIHHRRIKATLKKLNKPIGLRNAFAFFVAKETSSTLGVNAAESIKRISSQWNALPEDEKEKFRKMAEDDKIRYRAEMTSWTKKMIDEGHANLLEEMNKRKTQKAKKDPN